MKVRHTFSVHGVPLFSSTSCETAFVRLVVPVEKSESGLVHRLLDISASGVDAIVELKPEGKVCLFILLVAPL